MTIACVLITHLPLKLEELRRQADLRGKVVIVYQQVGLQQVVVDRSWKAHEIGIGISVKDALSRCPHATLIEMDELSCGKVWEGMLDSLEQRSPVVEDAGLGIAYMDLNGLEKLYGDEPRLVKTLLNALPGGYRPRVGVAEGKFPAFAAALHAEPCEAFRAPSDIGSFLAPLSVLRLPTSRKIQERLLEFGLENIGHVARLTLDAMQGQFGKEGGHLWWLANGIDRALILPRRQGEPLTATAFFDTPMAALPAILVTLQNLLGKLFLDSRRGHCVRSAVLDGQADGRPPWIKRIALREPVGDREQVFRIIRDALDGLALSFPLESISLTLDWVIGEVGRQGGFFRTIRRQAQLDDSVRQLRSRLGYQPPIYLIREVEPWSRIPERRHVLVTYEP